MVDIKDIDKFIKWYMEDDHEFDVELIIGDKIEFYGFINTKTRKSYTTGELFDYYLKYVK